jgi:hypothetical protein
MPAAACAGRCGTPCWCRPEHARRPLTAPAGRKSVKQADRPDSVRPQGLRPAAVTAIPLGRGSPTRLGATYPPAPRAASSPAYLVLLRAEIARFTRPGAWPRAGWLLASGFRPTSWRLCLQSAPACAGGSQNTPSGTPGRLVSVALILTSRWTAVSCCAALCSPDLPPGPCFHARPSGGLACFTRRIIRPGRCRRAGDSSRSGSRTWRRSRCCRRCGRPRAAVRRARRRC